MTQPRRVAVLGAGHAGPVFARLAVDAGLQVAIAASGSPENLALVMEVVLPEAQARWAVDAAADADVVVMAIPLHKLSTFDPDIVAGKLVIDAMNYWAPADGVVEMFQDQRYSTSEIVQRRLAKSTVVKSLNHVAYQDLAESRRPTGSPERIAMGVAGDDPSAAQAVADLVERFGFDAVRLPSLRAGRVLEPGGPVFGALLTRPQLEIAIGAGVA